MIHGRDRHTVLAQIAQLGGALDLMHVPHAVLFSLRRFKQRAARYRAPETQAAEVG
jgi:siroheme decarboxylase